MPIPPQPTELSSGRPSRQRTFSERVFLSDFGRLRPIIRAALFILAVLFLNIEVARIVFNLVGGVSFWRLIFWNSFALAIVFLLASWVFVRLADGRPFSSLGLSFRRGWSTQLAIGFSAGLALQLFVMLILAATRAVHFSGGVIHDFYFWKRVAMNAVLFFLAAVVEELSFRGYAFQRLMDSVGAAGAIIATSVLFGVAHAWNPDATFFSTLNTILAGVLLAVPYVRTRSMWVQIGLHWSWNLALVTIVSLPVSGIDLGPNLFVTQDSGPPWLNGGPYGPEAGAAVTLASLVAIAWLLRTRLLAPSPSEQEDL